MHVRGDFDAAVEREPWAALVEDGLADGWERREEADSERWGPQGVALSRRLTSLSSRMARKVFEQFDPGERRAPVDTYSDEGPLPVGWWTLWHFLANQQALSADGEIDACMECVRNRPWTLAARDGRRRTDERIDDLEAVREEAARITGD